MRVTLKQLEAFIAVATTESFSLGADVIHVSQPAISTLIRNLERQLGVKLFKRGARGVILTTIGRELFPSIQKNLTELNEAVSGVLYATSPPGGTVSLACIPSVAAQTMPKLIADFQKEHPQIKIQIYDAMVENRGILEMLRDGLIDYGVASQEDAAELQFKALYNDELVALINSQHHLAATDSIALSELISEPIIGMSKNSYVRRLTDEAFSKLGVSKHPYGPVSLITTAVSLARSGLGIAILPISAAKACNLESIQIVRLKEPVIVRPVGFLYRSMTSLSPAAKIFMNYVGANLAE